MIPDWVVTASNLSGPAILVIIIYLGWSRKWVWGHHYDELRDRLEEMREERDQYKEMLFRALKTAEAAVGRASDGES